MIRIMGISNDKKHTVSLGQIVSLTVPPSHTMQSHSGLQQATKLPECVLDVSNPIYIRA